MTQILAVIGSVTPPGRLHTALSRAAERARSGGNSFEVLDLATLRLDFVDGRPPEQHNDDSARVIAEVSKADAVIFASPVYRASYTGALKNLLDWLPVESLQGKPVGVVAIGATQHHYLGVEGHLRDVLAWFGALVAPSSVYLASEDFSEGVPSTRAEAALDDLIGTLGQLAGISSDVVLGPLPLAARR